MDRLASGSAITGRVRSGVGVTVVTPMVRRPVLMRIRHVIVGLFLVLPSVVWTQEVERSVDEMVFDEMVIKGDARVFRLVPLELAPRAPVTRGADDEELIIRLLDRPDQKYSVKWGDIERITLWEEAALRAAVEQAESGRFTDAYVGFLRVQRRSPGFPGLDSARQGCLMAEGRQRLAAGQPESALVPLRELALQNRDYPELGATIGSVVDQLVERDFAAGQEAAARELVDTLAADFPDHSVVSTRRQQLMDRAREHLSAVVEAMRAERWRESHDALERSLAIWPTLAEAQPVLAELNAKYPLVRVGVRDRARNATIVPGVMTWEHWRLRTLIPLDVTTPCQPPSWPAGLAWPVSLGAATGGDALGSNAQVLEVATSDRERRFLFSEPNSTPSVPPPLREITERYYENMADAIRDFDARRLAVLDRVAPWELDLVRTRPDLMVVPYAGTTVHWLIPNPRSPRMVSGSARRSLSLGIARERIIEEDLNGGSPPAVVPLSGLFPRGSAQDDERAALPYDPRLAIALSRSAPRASDERAARLVLVYDRSLLTRRAAQALQQQLKWDGLGYDVELREPPPQWDFRANGDWDLALVEWVGMDPRNDVWKLANMLAETGTLNGALGEALQQFGKAVDDAERDRCLVRVEQCLLDQSLVIPLWQFAEHLVIHKSWRGVGDRPVSLYEHVTEWARSEMP